MINLFEKWCYGGKNRDFFERHKKVIAEYNSKNIGYLIILLTGIIGAYLMLSIFSPDYQKYFKVNLSYTIAFALMYLAYRFLFSKSIKYTELFMCVFFIVIFSFTLIIGVFFEHNAVMFLILLLMLPLLFVAPMHHTYAFLTVTQIIFSILVINKKSDECAHIDVIHGITCLVISFFVGHQVLKNYLSNLSINDKLKKMSNSDGLTGIPNRRCLDQYLHNICMVFDSLVFAIIDIDNFKAINDTYGHLKGDEIIKEVAMILEEYAAEKDFFLARYGGDEFVIVDTDHSPDEVESIIDTILDDVVSKKLICNEAGRNIMTLSVGYAEVGAGCAYETIIKRADKALYKAKANGKNCVARE